MLLADQPMHGYEIIQQIGARSGGAWQPSPGSVYPALQMLEDQGLIEAEAAEGKRTFHLTDAGREHVAQHREGLAAVWTAVQGAADDVSTELRDLVDQVGMAAGQVVRVGAPAQMAAARDLLTATRQQLYRILAEDTTGDSEAQ
jgi:DNA-binding PadR family transcriptional regulator